LRAALIDEADAFVAMWKDVKLPDGRDRIVPTRAAADVAIEVFAGSSDSRLLTLSTSARCRQRR